VGNSFGFAGRIRDKLGISRQVTCPCELILIKFVFLIKQIFYGCLTCFKNQNSYLENFKRSLIKVPGGPHVARGPDVPRPSLCSRHTRQKYYVFTRNTLTI